MMMNKVPYLIKEVTRDVQVAEGKSVKLNAYKAVDARCMYRKEISVGDLVKVVSGKKIEKGTEGLIEAVYRNKFQNDPQRDPCVLLKIQTGVQKGQKVWTTLQNCCKITGLKEVHIMEMDPCELLTLDLDKAGFVSKRSTWWVKDEKTLVHSDVSGTDKEYDIQENTSSGDSFKAVVLNGKKEPAYIKISLKESTDNCIELKKCKSIEEAQNLLEKE